MTEPIKTVIITSERGYGLTFEDGPTFLSVEEAKAYCKDFNAQYDFQASVPGYYKVARWIAS